MKNDLPDETPPEWRERDEEVAQYRQSLADAERRRAEAEAKETLDANIKLAGIPPDVQDAYAWLIDTPAVVEMRKNADARILVLAGPFGVGKTVAAYAWLRSRPAPWVWTKAPRLESMPYDYADLCRFKEASALVIDDMGCEFVDTRGRYWSTLNGIIDERREWRRPTCLTTNITDKRQFAERYGGGLADRLCDGGAWIVCAGNSLRRTKKC